MDDLMKAIMAKSEQEIAKSKRPPSGKEKDSSHNIRPDEATKVDNAKNKAPAPTLDAIPVSENWSAETQKTQVLPTMLGPQTSEPEVNSAQHNDAQIAARGESNKATSETMIQTTPIIEVEEPKLQTGMKIYWIFSCGAFTVAISGAVYTLLKVSGAI